MISMEMAALPAKNGWVVMQSLTLSTMTMMADCFRMMCALGLGLHSHLLRLK
jgi:hypothetical protein